MTGRIVTAVIVSIAIATAIHLDWHAARPTIHHLSLGLPWHWLLAVPVFAAAAYYVARAWPWQMAKASAAILGSAIIVGGILEPGFEFHVGGAPAEWAFGAQRFRALLTFSMTGLLTYAVVSFMLLRAIGPVTPERGVR